MRGKSSFALALLSFLIVAGVARADEIRLKDGTKIIGTIVGFENDSFRVETSYGFALIRKDKVADINITAAKPEAKPESKTEFESKKESESKKEPDPKAKSSASATPPAAAATTVAPAVAKKSKDSLSPAKTSAELKAPTPEPDPAPASASLTAAKSGLPP